MGKFAGIMAGVTDASAASPYMGEGEENEMNALLLLLLAGYLPK